MHITNYADRDKSLISHIFLEFHNPILPNHVRMHFHDYSTHVLKWGRWQQVYLHPLDIHHNASRGEFLDHIGNGISLDFLATHFTAPRIST